MNPETILPCPFCSTEPLLQEFPAHEHVFATFMPDHEGSWAIECPGCGVGVCTDTRENAIAIWNCRPKAESQPSPVPSQESVESVPVQKLRELHDWCRDQVTELANNPTSDMRIGNAYDEMANRLAEVIKEARGTK